MSDKPEIDTYVHNLPGDGFAEIKFDGNLGEWKVRWYPSTGRVNIVCISDAIKQKNGNRLVLNPNNTILGSISVLETLVAYKVPLEDLVADINFAEECYADLVGQYPEIDEEPY